jgi:hypothetical protein
MMYPSCLTQDFRGPQMKCHSASQTGFQFTCISRLLHQDIELGVTAGEDGKFAFSSVRSGLWRLGATYELRGGDRPVPMSGAVRGGGWP